MPSLNPSFFRDLLPVWTWALAAWVCIAGGTCAAALLFPRLARRVAGICRGTLVYLSRHALSMLAVPVIVFGLAVLVWAGGFPLPHIHDEFSYLLAADTFAHGRLANPPHPRWPSLETFHVNQQPVYVSMYLPGWGLVLAAGQVLLGHPWMAVWGSALGMVLAAYWAALGWLPRAWALAAGLSSAGLVMGGYWLSSYWGGTLAATGGALLIGGWPRIAQGRWQGSLAFAVGAVVLLYTRPWEGAVLVGALGLGLLRRRVPVWAPMMLFVGLAAVWLAYYNWRTTANPLEPAYVRNMATYHHRRIFVFGADREPPPAYRHEVMRQLYSNGYNLQAFSAQALTRQMIPSFTFFGGHLLLFVILAGPWLLFRDRRIRPVTWSTAAVCGVAMLSLWTRPHYLAPAMAGIMIVSMQALRFAGTLRWRRVRVGRLLAFTALAAWLVLRAGIGVARLGEDASPKPWVRQRQEIARSLEAGGGRHLILVRYDLSRHNPNDEWVFNKSDLGTGAPVIWARALDDLADGQLRRYYPDRQAWLVEVDAAGGPRLHKVGE